METKACHGPAKRERFAAEIVILDVLTVDRVARWCGVTPGAVYQWLSRRRDNEAEPVPLAYVPMIVRGAKAEGVVFDVAILWPAIRAFA